MANRLEYESSPYLRQHKDNPVDWYPWGTEALSRARNEMKPIFLSIGYSSCHWCHVMERESFSDPSTAEIINENFVAIKLDREERPDLDHLYMTALQMMAGQGGWPLNIFLTPDLKPFFGGTYFPSEARYGRPPFRDILLRLAEIFQTQQEAVQKNANQITGILAQQGQFFDSAQRVDRRLLEKIVTNSFASVDHVNGGLGGAPKFFHVDGLRLLLQQAVAIKNQELLASVENSLKKMACGGVYDQVGGGFHRYSTDAEWKIPHFEKMLYDNALLARLYSEAFQATQNSFYRRVAVGIFDWLDREMTHDGLFYSAMDADTDHEEGKFYVWSFDELEKSVPADQKFRFLTKYQVTKEGNFDGANILSLKEPLSEKDDEVFRSVLGLLRELRNKRPKPGIDTKIQTSWNALMVSALTTASKAFSENALLARARVAAQKLWDRAFADGALSHLSDKSIPGFLEDHAYFGEALLDLFDATNENSFLERAKMIGDIVLRDYYDSERGGFWTTLAAQSDILVRVKEVHDNALPSPYAVMISVLDRLHRKTGDQRYGDAAAKSLGAIAGTAAESPGGFNRLGLVLVDWLEGPSCQDGVCVFK